MSVYKRGEIYHYRFTIKGQRFRNSCRTSNKKLAEEFEAKLKYELYNGIALGKWSPLTWEEIIDVYIESKQNIAAKGTIDMFKSIKTHLKDSKIFYKPVDTNTANILKDYLKGLKLSDSTIIVSLSKLQACYNLAKKKGKTLENTIFDTDGLTLNSKDVFFSKDEWTNFISLVKEEDYRNLFILMLNTGARIRELLTLTKDRVFLDTDTPHIFIPMELNKTRELKYIPLLCEDAKNSLKKLLSLSKTHFVINKSISAINYRIKHYAKLSNIARAEKMSCHTFRHTFITWAETGVFDFLNGKSMDSRLIKLTVGHSLNSNITENNYTHRQLEDYFKLLNKGN